MQQELIRRISLKKLSYLKSDVDKLDTGKVRNVSSRLSRLKPRVDNINIGKLETTLVDLSKLSHLIKMMLLKRINIMLRQNTEDKLPDISNLATYTTVNA